MMLFEYLGHRHGFDARKQVKKVLSRYEGRIFGFDTDSLNLLYYRQ